MMAESYVNHFFEPLKGPEIYENEINTEIEKQRTLDYGQHDYY